MKLTTDWLANLTCLSSQPSTLNFNLVADLQNETNFSQEDENDDISDSPAQFGIVTALLLALIIRMKFALKKSQHGKGLFIFELLPEIKIQVFKQTIAVLTVICLLPLLLMIIAIATSYKMICIALIKLQCKNYIKMLNCFDVIWALEENESKSIINVVGLIEADSSENLLKSIREKIKCIYDKKESSVAKLFYKKLYKFGYYYWGYDFDINIEEYVKVLYNEHFEVPINEDELQSLVSSQCNMEMPYKNEGLWEILVSNQYLHETEKKGSFKYPIIFRVHHSLGDGIALIQLLIYMLTDNYQNFNLTNCSTKKNVDKHKKYTLELKDVFASLRSVFNVILSLINQISRTEDKNIFHGQSLSGKKNVTWLRDSDANEELLRRMKCIKTRLPSVKFTDLLICAVSSSFHNQFAQDDEKVSAVTTVIPARVDSSIDDHRLDNNFTVALLTIPINSNNIDEHKSYSIKTRLLAVQKYNNNLRESSDFLANYYFIKVFASILPKKFLAPILESKHATLVVSNMQGPGKINICGRYPLEKLLFFVPNKGNTGIGITSLSYGGKLCFAIMADEAVIASREQLYDILDGMVQEINKLDLMTQMSLRSQDSVEVSKEQNHKSSPVL